MRKLSLLRLDRSLIDSLERDVAGVEVRLGIRLGNVMEWLGAAAGETAKLLDKSPREWPWGSYLSVDSVTQESGYSAVPGQVLGICAFKDAPNSEGVVEIAYFTFPPFEGRGVATAMARELIALARAHPKPPQVIAHTLPERNASTRVLEKNGMRLVGEVIDPEDGRVWRWVEEQAR